MALAYRDSQMWVPSGQILPDWQCAGGGHTQHPSLGVKQDCRRKAQPLDRPTEVTFCDGRATEVCHCLLALSFDQIIDEAGDEVRRDLNSMVKQQHQPLATGAFQCGDGTHCCDGQNQPHDQRQRGVTPSGEKPRKPHIVQNTKLSCK
ncbi:hypothetical protein Are01nite_22850 [Actinoplanes regularis]|nr:hypothetical protein Are01nite_22850 [Actinoplanes regularis]